MQPLKLPIAWTPLERLSFRNRICGAKLATHGQPLAKNYSSCRDRTLDLGSKIALLRERDAGFEALNVLGVFQKFSALFPEILVEESAYQIITTFPFPIATL
jgi:hypothetical protein